MKNIVTWCKRITSNAKSDFLNLINFAVNDIIAKAKKAGLFGIRLATAAAAVAVIYWFLSWILQGKARVFNSALLVL